MPMTVIVTRNAEERVRGFLASCMLELASGVYSSPNMNASVRTRVWAVLEKWGVGQRGDGATMVWQDRGSPGGQGVQSLGEPPLELHAAPGIVLTRKPLSEEALRSLTSKVDPVPF